MVASHTMRAIRDLPLAASLALTGAALFFGGGSLDGSLPWLGGGALLAVLASLLFWSACPPGCGRWSRWRL